MTQPLTASHDRRQPRALYVLFFTEMWERFSFYGMLSLLELYARKHLGFDHARSLGIVGTYTSLVYLTPFFGGLLADRKLGYKRSIVIGALLMLAGHALMAIDRLPIFYLALGLLVLGNGAFKPNISTVVGKLYPPGDPRQDRGFTIFYMGINLGALFSPLICGNLGEHVGWHYGFAAAGVGMAIGLLVFLLGQRTLAGIDLGPPARHERSAGPRQRLTRAEWKRIGALALISIFVIIFWAGYEQSWGTLTVWADENTHTVTLLGRPVGASQYQTINPLFIITLAPLVSAFWGFLQRRGREPSSPAKMALGLLLLAASFGVMALAATTVDATGRTHAGWLVGCYLLMTLGELALSPVGLSLVAKLAPARMGAMLMGAWFLSTSPGYKLGGMLGALWKKTSHMGFFLIFAGASMGAALLLFLLLRPIHRMAEERD